MKRGSAIRLIRSVQFESLAGMATNVDLTNGNWDSGLVASCSRNAAVCTIVSRRNFLLGTSNVAFGPGEHR